MPASRLVNARAATCRASRRFHFPSPQIGAVCRRSSQGRIASYPAISARTAEKLIWKLTPTTSHGSISMIATAASASPRTEIARRPATTARVNRHAMAKLRRIGRCTPVISM